MDATLTIGGAYEEAKASSGITPPDFTVELTLDNNTLTLTGGTYIITLAREST